MNKYFILCVCSDGESTYLNHWSLKKEEFKWEYWGWGIENPKDITEILQKNPQFLPYLFDSLEEAKEAVEIIIAHDDPNDNNIYKYHIVTVATKITPDFAVEIIDA